MIEAPSFVRAAESRLEASCLEPFDPFILMAWSDFLYMKAQEAYLELGIGEWPTGSAVKVTNSLQ